MLFREKGKSKGVKVEKPLASLNIYKGCEKVHVLIKNKKSRKSSKIMMKRSLNRARKGEKPQEAKEA